MRLGPIFRALFVIVACVSLLANAVVIGFAVRAYHSGTLPFAGGGGIGLGLERAERRAIFSRLRDERPRLRMLRRELRARRAEMVRALTAEPPDPDEIRRTMAAVRSATEVLQGAVQEVVLEAVMDEGRPR
ncbi:MAG: periplasmic heavy metal sensor [Pseudomonadota bacterium]